MPKRSIEQLRDELRQIDDDLARLNEQERDAERGIDALALQARRGDGEAERQLSDYEKSRAAASNSRRRLQAARASIEAEVQVAQATAETEARKERACEAKKIVAIFRKRGSEIDTGLRKLLEDYTAIQTDVSALSGLGATQINPRAVKVNCERALRAALMRTGLELPPVPPLERRTFTELVGSWSIGAERWIEAVLKETEETATQTETSHA